jgi:hypothetical protein
MNAQERLVLIEFNNSPPFIQRFVSKKEITIDIVAEYMIKNFQFNEEKDSITFLDLKIDTSII